MPLQDFSRRGLPARVRMRRRIAPPPLSAATPRAHKGAPCNSLTMARNGSSVHFVVNPFRYFVAEQVHGRLRITR